MCYQENHLYEFGPFQLSPAEGMLTRKGVRVHLAPKAFDVLVVLVERRSTIVSKQELIQAAWREVHVDESNVERQISDLRKILVGRAEEINDPYIKTVSKRGYQFVAPVKEILTESNRSAPSLEPNGNGAPPPDNIVPAQIQQPLQLTVKQPPPFITRYGLPILAVTVAMAIVGTILAGLNGHQKRASRLPVETRRSIAVVGVQDVSSPLEDPRKLMVLNEALLIEMSAVATLRIVSAEEVARMKLELNIRETDRLATEMLSRVRKRIGADLLLVGSYFRASEESANQIRIDLKVQDTATGEVVASVRLASSKDNVQDVIRNAANTLRKQLRIEDLSAEESRYLQASRLRSPEAARIYGQGMDKLRHFDAIAAQALFTRALDVEASPLIRSALAESFWMSGFERKAKDEARAAVAEAGRLSRQDQLRIEGRYSEIAGDWQRAVRIYTALWTLFPDDPEYALRLASSETEAGNAPRAYGVLEELRRLPGLVADDPRIDLTEAAIAEAIGDFTREHSAATAAADKSKVRGAQLLLASALLRQCWASNQLGDYQVALIAARQARQIFSALGDRGNEARSLRNLGDVLDDSGHHIEGQKSYEEALAVFRRIGHSGGVAVTLNNLAYALRNQGDLGNARLSVESSGSRITHFTTPFSSRQLPSAKASTLPAPG